MVARSSGGRKVLGSNPGSPTPSQNHVSQASSRLRTCVRMTRSGRIVVRVLSVNNNGASLLRLRGHAARLGLDVSHLERRDDGPQQRPAFAPPRARSLRTAASSIATAWFALRGYSTAVPLEPQVYDLLVHFPDGIRKVQVKSTTSRTHNGRWQVQVGHRPYSPDSAGRAPYHPDTLDFFFIVTGDGRLYLIPSRLLAGRVAVHVDAYCDHLVGDASSLMTWD